VHFAYIWIGSHLAAKNYQNWWKFDEVLTKTNLLSFFGTRCINAKRPFFIKMHFAWRKSAAKFLCAKTVSDKVVRHSLAYLSV